MVGRIYPDEWMPVDEYGIRADLWMDMNSPVGRNNPGQLYEMGIGRINEFVRRKVEQVNITQGTEAAFSTLLDWYHDINKNYADTIRDRYKDTREQKQLVADAIETYPKIWVPPFLDTLTPKEDNTWHALENIQAWAKKWNVKPSPVRYKVLQADGSGKEFVTETKFSIGSKYIIHLHKIPEITAPGPASVNPIGVPTKSAFEQKHYPVSTSPYRYGEDELRVMSMDADIREVTRFQNMLSNSPQGAATLIQSLLTAQHPTRIKRIPISNGTLLETSAILKLFHSVTASLGVETRSTKIENPEEFVVPEELTEAIWSADIVNYGNGPHKDDDDDDVIVRRSNTKRAKMRQFVDMISETDEDPEILDDDTEDAL